MRYMSDYTSKFLILGDNSMLHASVIDLGKGKFYYAWPWPSQRACMLELFSLYANLDAHFFIWGAHMPKTVGT